MNEIFLRKCKEKLGWLSGSVDYLHFLESQKKMAMDVLASIEADTGRVLTKNERLNIEQYAEGKFGDKAHAAWLCVYATYRGVFEEGWFPDDYFGRIVCPRINGGARWVSGIKTVSACFLDHEALPRQWAVVQGVIYNRYWEPLADQQLLREVFINNKHALWKRNSSRSGLGVSLIDFDSIDLVRIRNAGDAVIQEQIVQLDWFDQLMPRGGATIRITTCRNTIGKVEARASYLRVGSGEGVVKSAEAIRVPVIDDTGLLADYGTDSRWRRGDKHPETNCKYAGLKIPSFIEALTLCVSLHAKLPMFGVIGWDVIIDSNRQPFVIEWNAGWPDIKFSEAASGPCFEGLGWESCENRRAH